MNIHAIEEVKDVDQESRPVLAIRFGRGRTGGTTFLDFLIQRARTAGRTVTIADGDRKKPTLAGLYPPGEPGGALRPRGKDIGDVREWVTEITSQTAAAQVSMVLDMGAGDDVLELHGKDLNLREFCVASGVDPLAIYTIGPEVDDFDYVMGVYEDGYFRSDRALLVMNESLVPVGKSAGGMFDFVYSDPRFERISETARPVIMPKLACMGAMRQERLTYYDAAEGKRGRSGTAMSLGHQFIAKTWLNRMEENLAPVREWLP
jgi:hypothetical protein